MASAATDHVIPSDDSLLALLPSRSSYNVGEVKAILRGGCMVFKELNSERAQQIARRLCWRLRDRGEVWHRSADVPLERGLQAPRRHPDKSVLQRPTGFFKALVTKYIATEIHAPGHPIPFLGLEVFRSRGRSLIEQVPNFEAILRYSDLVFDRVEHRKIDFDIFDPLKYREPCQEQCVTSLSRRLASLVVTAPERFLQSSDYHLRFNNLCHCFALICQSLNCHPEVHTVLPVRLSCGDLPEHKRPQYPAALISRAEKQYLLPVRLWPVGENQFTNLDLIKNLSGWMQPTGIWDIPAITNPAREIFQRFRNCPILSVIDNFQLATRLPTSIRRYAHVWAYQDQLGDAEGCNLCFPPYDRLFTSPRAMLDLLFDSCHPLKISANLPFELIELDFTVPNSTCGPIGLELISENWLSTMDSSLSDTAVSQTEMFSGEDIPAIAHPLRTVFCKKSAPVDGQISCRLHKMCHLPPTAGSLYCVHHSTVMLDSYLKSTETYDGKLSIERIEKSSIAYQYQHLLERRQDLEQTWIIDVEYWSLAGDKSPIPWSLSIRTLSGSVIVRTTVDYDMDLWTLIEEIAPFTRRDGSLPSPRALKALYTLAKRHYQRSYTHGLTIEQIRAQVSYESQLLISWGTVLDLQVFERILKGGNQPLAQRCPATQVIDVFRIIQAGLGDEFPSMALGDVHRCLCAGKLRRFHEADEDVLAVLDILEVLFGMARKYETNIARASGHLTM